MVIVITVTNSGTKLYKEHWRIGAYPENSLVKGLESTTYEKGLKELRMFTLEETHFKRKHDSFFKNTINNCLMEERLDLFNAFLEDTIRAKEWKLNL